MTNSSLCAKWNAVAMRLHHSVLTSTRDVCCLHNSCFPLGAVPPLLYMSPGLCQADWSPRVSEVPSMEFADRTADVEQASRISAIKELFQDYGDGFLAACLSSYGQDPERVINALLEGSLSPQLSSLDPSMPLQASLQAATNGKGKGKARATGAILLPIVWRPLC
jgi:hypothetical protein